MHSLIRLVCLSTLVLAGVANAAPLDNRFVTTVLESRSAAATFGRDIAVDHEYSEAIGPKERWINAHVLKGDFFNGFQCAYGTAETFPHKARRTDEAWVVFKNTVMRYGPAHQLQNPSSRSSFSGVISVESDTDYVLRWWSGTSGSVCSPMVQELRITIRDSARGDTVEDVIRNEDLEDGAVGIAFPPGAFEYELELVTAFDAPTCYDWMFESLTTSLFMTILEDR